MSRIVIFICLHFFRYSVLKLLQDTCRNTGTTVIVITHNQALTAMADRVITVKSGTVEKVVMNDNIRNVEDLEW